MRRASAPQKPTQAASDEDLVPAGVNSLEGAMKSLVTKRSIVIAGHKTSVSLEDAFWKGLKEIASERDVTLSEMVAAIDSGRPVGNLSSAIRLFVLDHYRTLIGAAAGAQGAHVEIAAAGPSTLPNKG
jgi:predicted DNA-binding ribbon-helix-helix protein